MTDEPTTDQKATEKALGAINQILSSLNADTGKAAGWIKTYMAWAIGLGCFLVGFIAGHVAHWPHS